mgnify:FL=1|tara:strand:+ start:3839 stop:4519 length:681 start_codon:yes stop_codon:yes gene_type:complete
MKAPDLYVGKQLQVGAGKPDLLGRGPTEVRGSAFVQGPEMVGDPSQFPGIAGKGNPFETAALMAGQNGNPEMLPPPFYAFFATTFARIKSFLKVDLLLTVKVIKSKVIYAEVIMAKVKNFAIPHPTLPNTNLVYACLEGPENGVYVRGVLRNNDTIKLPEVWRELVDPRSITVSLTPVGSEQSLVVKRVTNNEVVVQSRPGPPIHCHYHIFAERKDVEKLVTEVSI